MPDTWLVFREEHRAVYHLDGDLSSIETCNSLLESAEEPSLEGVTIYELDFTKARYISSFGIAVLIRLKKRLANRAGVLKLTNVHKDIRRVFTITRTDDFLLSDEQG